MILEALGQLIDIVGRPTRHFHAEMKPHLSQHLLDLVERLAPEVRRAQHLGLGLLNEVADIDDIVVLETVGRTHRWSRSASSTCRNRESGLRGYSRLCRRPCAPANRDCRPGSVRSARPRDGYARWGHSPSRY